MISENNGRSLDSEIIGINKENYQKLAKIRKESCVLFTVD